MSKQAGKNDIEGLRGSIQYGLRFLIITLIPSAFILSILGKELISVAMFRGNFTLEATILTARILTAYSIGLISVGAFNFLQRFFYSIHNYRLPFLFAVTVAVIDIILSIWLKNTHLRVIGLALANTIAFTAGFILSIFVARKKVNGLNIKPILITLLKVMIATVITTVILFILKDVTGTWWRQGSTLFGFAILIVEGILALGIILGMYFLLKVDIFISMINRKRKTDDS